jgi:hypothetical protein
MDGKNICVTKLPLGAKVTKISPLEIDYPCEFGLKELNGYCVEVTRTATGGSIGQVCSISESSTIGCDSGLSCGYDNTLHNILETNNNTIMETLFYPTITDTGVSIYKIGGEYINDIGYCGRQVAVKDQSCNSRNFACISPYVCINEEINSKTVFNHCGHGWDSLNGSGLVKCPDGFDNTILVESLPRFYPVCLAETNTICQVNNDCSSGECGTKGVKRILQYSPGSEKFVIPEGQPGQYISEDTSLQILMTKDQVNQKPSLFGYSSLDREFQEINIVVNQMNGKEELAYMSFYTPEFPLKYKTKVFKKSDGKFRIGLFYLHKYQNYVRREYPIYRSGDVGFVINRTCGLSIGSKYFIFYIYTTGEVKKSAESLLLRGDLKPTTIYTSPTVLIRDDIVDPGDAAGAKQIFLVTYDNRYQFNYNSKDFVPKGNTKNGNSPKHTYLTSSLPFELSGLRTGDLVKFGQTDGGVSLIYEEYQKGQTTSSRQQVLTPDPNKTYSIVSGGSFDMTATNLLYTDNVPSEMEGRDRIFLSESYTNTTKLPTVLDNQYYNSLEVTGVSGDGFLDAEDKLYMEYLPTYGVQMIYHDLDDPPNETGGVYVIGNRVNTVNGNLNSPIGILTDVDDFDLYSIDMTEDKLIVGCQITGTENLVFQCDYTTSSEPGLEFSQHFTLSQTQGGPTTSNYINYGNVKTYVAPRPRIHKSGGYVSVDGNYIQPYKVDDVRFYENTENGVDHMISYKEVEADSYRRLNIANQVKLRSFSYDYEEMLGIFKPDTMNLFYDGVQKSGESSKIFSGVYGKARDEDYFLPNDTVRANFGFCQPIEMTDILPGIQVKSQNLANTNYYPENGEPYIYFKNKTDIDTILKYSSSELVLGFFLRENRSLGGRGLKTTGLAPVSRLETGNGFPLFTIVIPEIYDYTINDKTLEETLVMSANFNVTRNLQDFHVYLYPNNIVPVSSSFSIDPGPLGSEIIVDPGIIYTSQFGFGNMKTGYNKIFINNSIYNIPTIDGIAYSGASEDILFTDKFVIKSTEPYTGEKIMHPISECVVGSGVAFSAQNTPYINVQTEILGKVDYSGNQMFLVNNLFMSSMMLKNGIIFSEIYYPTTYTVQNPSVSYPSSSPNYRSKNYLFTKYTDSDGNQKNRARGDLLLPINTIPFYTGNRGVQSSYDQTFKTQIEWPGWLTDINSVPLKMEKMIFSFNPGNMVNEMFYYAFAEISGEKYLLYLPVNMSETNAILAGTVPMIVRNSNLRDNDFLSGFFMTPYDRSLYALGNLCI